MIFIDASECPWDSRFFLIRDIYEVPTSCEEDGIDLGQMEELTAVVTVCTLQAVLLVERLELGTTPESSSWVLQIFLWLDPG